MRSPQYIPLTALAIASACSGPAVLDVDPNVPQDQQAGQDSPSGDSDVMIATSWASDGALRGRLYWPGASIEDAIVVVQPGLEYDLVYDVGSGALLLIDSTAGPSVLPNELGPGHHLVQARKTRRIMSIPADQAGIRVDDTRPQLELTIDGRTLRVSVNHFLTRALDDVDYIDLVAEEADSKTTLTILTGRAASSLTSDESAQTRRLVPGPWAEYAGVQRFAGACTFEIQAIDADRESVQLVIGVSESKLRLLLWSGFWREQRPSMEESFVRDESELIAFR